METDLHLSRDRVRIIPGKRPDPAVIRKIAEEYYRSGQFYCSEATVKTFNEELGLGYPEEIIRLASGFPLGIGGAGCSCGAVTGGVMATVLGFTLEEFSDAALSAKSAEKINSMCTVFAESEVVSLVTQGADRNEVALGIHRAIISRAAGLLIRVAPRGRIFFAGGVALNNCARALLEQETGRSVFVPPDPQIVGAVGAALVASENI